MLAGMRAARALLVTAAAALALAAPALAAGDRIVHGRSIGAIAVGDERATIGLRFGGDGVVIARSPSPLDPGNRNLDRVTVAYPARSLTVRFPTDEASSGALSVATRSPRYRTAAGVGVGSPRSAVLAAFPTAVCTPRACRVGPRPSDPRATRFAMVAGRVVRVAVLRIP